VRPDSRPRWRPRPLLGVLRRSRRKSFVLCSAPGRGPGRVFCNNLERRTPSSSRRKLRRRAPSRPARQRQTGASTRLAACSHFAGMSPKAAYPEIAQTFSVYHRARFSALPGLLHHFLMWFCPLRGFCGQPLLRQQSGPRPASPPRLYKIQLRCENQTERFLPAGPCRLCGHR